MQPSRRKKASAACAMDEEEDVGWAPTLESPVAGLAANRRSRGLPRPPSQDGADEYAAAAHMALRGSVG